MNQKSSKKSLIILSIILLLVIAGFVTIYAMTKPKGTEGAKEITVDVVVADQETKEFVLHTDSEYLRGALEEADLVSGTESEYGLFIKEVNGITVNDDNQEWWCVTQDGEQLMYGVDEIAIADGDHYELTLTVGY